MSDPKWKRFLNPVMSTAVFALSGLISAELLDKLLERECLSDEKYEKLLQSLDDSQITSKEIARKLFLTLKCLPPPSFDNFCAVIEQVYGKNHLFCCLNPSLQESKDVDSASQSCEQSFDTSSGDNVLNIFVDEKLMEEYQPHHECVVGLVKSNIATTEMKTKSLQVSLQGLSSMKLKHPREKRVGNEIVFSEHCGLRIFLPETTTENFEKQRKIIFRRVSNLLDFTDIEILPGSCHVILTLKAIDFVRFLCNLHDSRLLIPFIQLDPEVEIEFDNLRPIKLTYLLKQTVIVSTVGHALLTVEQTAANKRRRLLAKCHGLLYCLDTMADVQNEVTQSELHERVTQLSSQGVSKLRGIPSLLLTTFL